MHFHGNLFDWHYLGSTLFALLECKDYTDSELRAGYRFLHNYDL